MRRPGATRISSAPGAIVPRVRRVVLVDAYPHVVGGATLMLLALAERAAGAGWSPMLHLFGPGDAVADAASDHGIAVRRHLVRPGLARYGRASQASLGARVAATAAAGASWLDVSRLRGRVDVAHVNDHRGMVAAGPGLRVAGVPICWHVHSTPAGRHLDRMCARLAARTIVPAQVVADRMSLPAGRRVDIIANALPSERRAMCLETPWRGRHLDETAHFVAVGRLHPDKGHDVLIDAARRCAQRGWPVEVSIVGNAQVGFAAWQEHLRSLAAEVPGVRLLGANPRPADVVAGATAFVLPSREATEVQPLALLEAMTQGAPVIASRVGAVGDVVSDGIDGILVPEGDAGSLATAMLAMAVDGGRARLLGARARVRSAELDIDVMAERTMRIWAEIAR